MILPIDAKYRLAADRYCWTIQEYRGKRRQSLAERWEPVSWHPSLESAVNALSHLMLRTSEARTLADSLMEVDRITTTLCHALSPMFEVRRKKGAA
jgi:hypothetical protein